MKQALIFSGTTEGRELAKMLCEQGIFCGVCVATAYGEMVMEQGEGITVHTGRLSQSEMEQKMEEGDYFVVVDATHPFATEVSGYILEAARKQAIPYVRLKRSTEYERGREDYVLDVEACLSLLNKQEGNILLTTGSKEISLFCKEEAIRNRLYVRVLPSVESIAACERAGLFGKQILAMQGPFLQELNEAILKQYDIKTLVTKESGATGGMQEKLAAARKLGVHAIVIGNPDWTEGICIEEAAAKIFALYAEKEGEAATEQVVFDLTFVGMGMGSKELMTQEAALAVRGADILFGAKRLLLAAQSYDTKEEVLSYPYYSFSDCYPVLLKLQKRKWSRENPSVVFLFSGDTGFFSGAGSLYQAFEQERRLGSVIGQMRVLPGISSLSALCARHQISWEDTITASLHGRSLDVISLILSHKKTFLLLSGPEQLRALGKQLIGAGIEEAKLYIAYQMSYPEEEIFICRPRECEQITKEGLYACLIAHENVQANVLTHGMPDSLFIRGKVPMTKEEIREIILCKLGLKNQSVLYDIGSGTGSISIEAARLSPRLTVYAIEKKEEACRIIQQNKEKFGCENLCIIEGEATKVLGALTAPTHVFIGGSGGNIGEILSILKTKSSAFRLVMSAITLETLVSMREIAQEQGEMAEIIQVQVSRTKHAGSYHMLQAENPVYLLTIDFKKGESS